MSVRFLEVPSATCIPWISGCSEWALDRAQCKTELDGGQTQTPSFVPSGCTQYFDSSFLFAHDRVRLQPCTAASFLEPSRDPPPVTLSLSLCLSLPPHTSEQAKDAVIFPFPA
jgi:hypothetical protein